MRIKVGDTVNVIAGDEKGQNGKVIRVLTGKDKIVVEGFRAKDGSNLAASRGITLADGRKVFSGTADDGSPQQ